MPTAEQLEIQQTFIDAGLIGGGSITRLLGAALPRAAGFAVGASAVTAAIGGSNVATFLPSPGGGFEISGSSGFLGQILTAVDPLIQAGAQGIQGITGPAGFSARAPVAQQRFPVVQGGTAGDCNPCQPRPGPCDPAFIDQDFGAFGANPCSADPRYPREAMQNGLPVCKPARRKPRMNPFNPRANARAARRLMAFGKGKQRITKAVTAAARALK